MLPNPQDEVSPDWHKSALDPFPVKGEDSWSRCSMYLIPTARASGFHSQTFLALAILTDCYFHLRV